MTATLILSAVILGPQALAGWRGFGTAAHLTLLLLSLTVVSSALLSLAAQTMTPPPQPGETFMYTIHLTPLSYAAIGLAILAPLYWMLEPARGAKTTAAASVIAQALAMTFAATIAGDSSNVGYQLTAWLALTLTLALFALASWTLWQRFVQN